MSLGEYEFFSSSTSLFSHSTPPLGEMDWRELPPTATVITNLSQ